ncbi:MAG: DUF1840 domain-containing protein [Sterolibacterium sp.]|jgi:hypothetical protein|nr:DUF1840 domain-containing protein [Sterolibacterium sp.]
MIVTFQSKASGDVIMFGDVAHHMMQLMGKDITPQGIITLEQLPDAIARLRAAVTQDKEAHRRLITTDADPHSPPATAAAQPAISLTQRALPLLELLDRALHKQVVVVWGV